MRPAAIVLVCASLLAAGAVPAIQIPPSLPLGTKFSTPVCARVSALNAITHEV